MSKQTKPTSHAVLFIGLVLLILAMLYVGSYFALVLPDGRSVGIYRSRADYELNWTWSNYRFGYPHTDRFYWPLEYLDRRMRPGTWGDAPGWQEKFRRD